MATPIEVRVSRVKADEYGVRPLDGSGDKSVKYPEDGFVIRTNHPGSIPIYISKADMKRIKTAEVGEQLTIDSWKGVGGVI